jgi:hypothetical protein
MTKGALIYLCWFLSGLSCNASGANTHQPEAPVIHINVGERLPVDIPPGSEVSLKPKGIIRIQRDRVSQKWMMEGTRAGNASITIKSANEDLDLKILNISVAQPSEVRGRRPIKRGHFPSELCSHPGINCRADLGMISGISSSYEWRMHARNSCRQSKSCQVEVELTSEESQRMLQVFRDKIGNAYDVDLTTGGEISVGIPCTKDSKTLTREHIDFLTSGAVERGEIGLECKRPSTDQRFLVKFKLTAISNSDATDFGLIDPRNSKNRLGVMNQSPTTALNFLSDIRTSNRSESLGEPALIVDLGQKAKLTSGSEIVSGTEIDRQTGESKPHYKNLGLEVEAEISDVREDVVRARLVGRMKSQSLRSENKFSIQEINTEVSLKLGKEQVLGSSQISGEHRLSTNSSILGRIPIIGPLLEYRSDDQALSTVVISILVERIK